MGIGWVRSGFAVIVGGVLALAPWSVEPSNDSLRLLPYVPEYPHQAHGHELALRRLHESLPARQWLAAADRALLEPEAVALPFASRGLLAEAGAAAGFAFSVPAGRRVRIDVTHEGASGEVYVDLFERAGGLLERVAGSMPRSAAEAFTLDALAGGEYVLRVQPALAARAAFAVRVEASAVLAFPVAGVDGRAIWSGFGAERDGGRRAHRGVDIFAARGTPALAATDGWVTRVETTRVGGNVVWMQPLFGNLRLYYAHLDEQAVQPGDFVRAGQRIGAVGNTGNAVTTPPHLHFGVYLREPGRRGGARDPAEFLR